MKNHTVTILVKDEMIAAFAIDANDQTAIVGRFDARQSPPTFHRVADTFPEMAETLELDLEISKQRGWRVAWQGQRNYG